MGFTPLLAIDLILQTLWFVVLARVLISWVDRSGNGRVSRILFDMSEPILGPVRRILPSTAHCRNRLLSDCGDDPAAVPAPPPLETRRSVEDSSRIHSSGD